MLYFALTKSHIIAITIAAIFLLFIVVYKLGYFNTKISPKSSISFKDVELLNALGGKENILSATAQLSKLKITLKDNSKLNPKKLKTLGASGIMKTSKDVTIIFGAASEQIAKMLNK